MALETKPNPEPARPRRIVVARERYGLDAGAAPEQLAAAIRAGRWPSDPQFDAFLPAELRPVSRKHWTQLCVAARVAEWLVELELRSVVDIGSGSGKFCVATALASSARFIGIEQRPQLVAAARALAERFGVHDRVQFVRGTFPDTAAPPADAYYVYNPFGENRLDWREWLDDDVELSDERYRRDVASVGELLRRAPLGTCLIAYNGFGGRMPAGYRRIRSDDGLPSLLSVWRRTR
jgi:SAM-dependent methyltransferase